MNRLFSASLAMLAACFLLFVLPSAPAQQNSAMPPGQLVQLRITGEVGAPPLNPPRDGVQPPTGHLVEVEVSALSAAVMETLQLHLHLASGTSGAELLQLVHARLGRIGIASTLCMPSTQAAPEGPASATGASLWIDGATRVYLRLGGGLVSEVACAEGPPALLRLRPASAIEGAASVSITASTAVLMKGQLPIRRRETFFADLESSAHAADAATAVWEATPKTWVTDRPGTNAWRPIKMASGATITGVSVRLAGPSDWALEMEL